MANNFVSNANATDLMNAINQKKDTKPDTITWAEWIQLTDQEREGTHYIITDVPAQFSLNDAIFSLKNQTLVFTNKVATITDSRITSSAYLFTFYANEAVAQAAGIECTWSTGTITFTVVNDPVSDITLDILAILPALAPGGGEQIQSDWNQTDTSEPDYIKNKPTIPDISTKVSKSGDTMSGSLQINKPSASTSTEVSNLYLGNNIAGGTTGNSYGALTLFGKGTYKGRFIDIENALTADRDYQLPNKSGTLALTSDIGNLVSTYTNQTIPANSKTYIANVIKNTSVLLIPYTSNSDCIPYIATASGWLQLYVYNMGNTDHTIDVTVRRVI